MRPRPWQLTLLLAAFTPLPAGRAVTPDPVDFNRDVLPILSRNCFACHGPDDAARKAKVRLDVRAEALRKSRAGPPVIAPGQPEGSELIARILTDDVTEKMPPPRTKKTLSPAEKQTLHRWIASGAEYTPHWAFLPPRNPPVPNVRDRSWARNPIDRFVLARLEAEGMRPSPPADRYTLVRRVYLDLIGLPPAPAEADAFVRDPAPDAYERLVDRLLASPAYGERWARRWLDLARYADTNGYEKDRPRSIWPYRDWVIAALNADKPFDEFTVEQVAGDLLPGATTAQRVATGFHRNTMTNEEGGIDPLEFRFHALTDRLATTSTTWLGLTLGCAQCHSHKFDPFTHHDYYRLLAFLNNSDEPEMEVPTPEVAARRRELQARIASLESALPRHFPPEPPAGPADSRTEEARRASHLEKSFASWRRRERATVTQWAVLRPTEARANLPYLSVLPDHSVLAGGDQTKRDTYTVTFRAPPRGITALRLEALPHESLPLGGPGRAYYEGPKGDFFLSEWTLTADGKPVRIGGATESYARSAIGAGESGAALTLDADPHTGWSTAGREGQSHQAVYTLTEPLTADSLTLELLFDRHYSAGLGRFRIAATTSREPVKARQMPTDIEGLLAKADKDFTPEERATLSTYYLSVAPELAKARKEIDNLRKKIPDYPTTLIFRERPPGHPRPTFFHHRGEFLEAAERVEPAVPPVLHPLPDGPPDRLTFARWLVDPGNPLVGRVVMNRHWGAFFGQGIVRTPDDFGLQGDLPTHPKLLDWLALEFVRSGWSIKRMHRLIVTSATYRQSSRVSPDLLRRDPDNELLARGPRHRIEAELIRDTALAASGLLARKIGGPSVFPAQPPNVTTEGTYGKLDWKVSPGPDRHRRGLYTFSKRTAPFAMTAAFDAPSGEACLARRERTNTPLQALTALNGPTFVEVTQALGRLAAQQRTSEREKVGFLFRRCLTRSPDEEETALLLRFYQTQKQRLIDKELDAEALAGPGADAQERAAWTAVARVLLNLDETIVKE